MVATTNKGWTLPTPGGSAGTWGTGLNSAFGQIDNVLGGTIGVTVTGGTTTLTAAQTETLFIYVNGTLTSNATVVLTPEVGGPTRAQGFWLVQNDTTGNFTLTFSNGGGASLAVVPQGRYCLIYGHPSSGTRIIAADDGVVPSGTIFLCGNNAVPLGWTRLTSYNDYALRLVSGAGGGVGGTKAFTNVMSASIYNLAAHSHGLTDPGHTHSFTSGNRTVLATNPGTTVWYGTTTDNTNLSYAGLTVQSSGTGAVTAFDVAYYDVFLAQKN